MYYPCSENKGADQLRGYRKADLRLCFRIGKNPVFSRCGSYLLIVVAKTKEAVVLFQHDRSKMLNRALHHNTKNESIRQHHDHSIRFITLNHYDQRAYVFAHQFIFVIVFHND